MDFIGLVIGFLIALALSVAAGFVLAAGTALLFWSKWRRAIPLYFSAVLLVPLCVFWVYTAVALLPGESLFGDIDEPLPNGYHLRALGKMPDFATIDSQTSYGLTLPEYVGRLQVQGNLIVGQYSHPFDAFNSKPVEDYFLFDTTTGRHLDFPSPAVLQAQLKQPLDLLPTYEFQSSERSSRWKRAFDHVVMFGPIIGAWAMYLLAVVALRFTAYRGSVAE